MIDYTGKQVLVTGAATGIGAALSRALADRGAKVICADVVQDKLAETVGQICGDCHSLVCDLSQPSGAEELLQQAWELGGGLDLVCSNAGIGFNGSVADTSFDERMDRLFEVNFFSGMRLGQAYARRLTESGRQGRFMVTASENSLSVPDAVRAGRMAFYGATKHALLVAMEWFRIEQTDGPLQLHVLMPGAVYTPLIAGLLPDPALAPAELELIMPEECAERALKGMDLDLFYIPTQAHLLEDMKPRMDEVAASMQALEIELTC